MNIMQTNKTLIFDKNADAIFRKGDYINSYMVIDLKSVNLDFQIEKQNTTRYNLIATLTDKNNNPIPNNIIEFYKTISDDNCVIDFESDKDSVRNNQICILTATVTQNNNPLENILVQFYNDDILIGESITNEDGQALFEYVGYGTDDVIITAKSDNIISNSVNLGNYSDVIKNIELDNTNNIVQIDDTLVLTARILDEYHQPYENLSVSFMQKNKQLYTTKGETSSTILNYWSNITNSANTLTIDYTGILIETDASQYSSTYMQIIPLLFNTHQSVNEGYVIKYDAISMEKMYPMLAIKKSDGTYSYPSFNATGNCRLEIDKNGYKFYVNDVLVSDKSAIMSIDTFRWYLQASRSNGDSSIKFKNLSFIANEKIYPVGESIFVDKAITGKKNTHWNGTNVSISVESDGTLVSNSTGSSGSYTVLHPNTTTTPRYDYSFSSPLAIEFDIVNASDYTQTNVQIVDSNGHIALNRTLSYLGCKTADTHMKIIVTDTQVLVYTENKSFFYYSHSMDTNFRINFSLASGYDFKFKNFKVYEITENSITDADGIATCIILGDGSGLETYSAKYENIESEPITVIDGIKADIGTSFKHTDIWTQSLDYLQRETDCTTLSDTSTRLTYTTINDNIGIEFDVKVGYDSARFVTIRNGSTILLGATLLNLGLEMDNWYHIKIEINNGSCTISNNANDNTVIGSVTGFNRLYLNAHENSYISFRNFVVYPIEIEEPVGLLTLTSNKNTLSAYDSETATLTATYTENSVGVSGKTITFKKGSTILDTKTTNSNGVATYDYNADGSGDVTITVECESLSETQTIEDLLYFNDGTKISGITIPSGVTVTTEDGMLKIHGTTSGEKKIYYPKSFTGDDNFIIEFEVAKIGVEQSIALYLKDSTTANGCWFSYTDSSAKWNGGISTTWNATTQPLAIGDKVRIKQENGILKMYHNDTVLYTKSRNFSGTYYVGHYTNINRIQYVKNIKVKSL